MSKIDSDEKEDLPFIKVSYIKVSYIKNVTYLIKLFRKKNIITHLYFGSSHFLKHTVISFIVITGLLLMTTRGCDAM